MMVTQWHLIIVVIQWVTPADPSSLLVRTNLPLGYYQHAVLFLLVNITSLVMIQDNITFGSSIVGSPADDTY